MDVIDNIRLSLPRCNPITGKWEVWLHMPQGSMRIAQTLTCGGAGCAMRAAANQIRAGKAPVSQ